MNLVRRLFRRNKQPQNAAFSEQFWPENFFGNVSKSGKSVNVNSALEVTTVLACLRVIAEGVAQVPLKLFVERDDGGRDAAKDHSLYRALYRKPNPWQTSFEFRETLIFHVGLTGNFFAFKNKKRDRVTELIPFEPGHVSVKMDEKTRRITYTINYPGKPAQDFPSETIWHVRGPSWNSWMGLEAVSLAREAIGLAMIAEESQALLHGHGGQPGGLYSVEGQLGADQYKALRDWIEKQITGENRFKPFILDRGAKWTPTTMNGVDAQHLETRKHQVEEICRAFRVMPIMIGQAGKAATYASAEQMFLAHVIHTLSPWYSRLEQSIDANLLSESDQSMGFYSKFVPNALMRGAAKDRSEFYYKMWSMGAMSPNDIRAKEDDNPVEHGDTYYRPANFAPVGEAVQDGGEDEQIQP